MVGGHSSNTWDFSFFFFKFLFFNLFSIFPFLGPDSTVLGLGYKLVAGLIHPISFVWLCPFILQLYVLLLSLRTRSIIDFDDLFAIKN